MDAQDHKKNALSEQDTHSVQLCHKCGWPFPNPHPSAKHRRAHKRVCGTVEGYKLLDSGSDHSNFPGSDNEHVSDDERRNPSPKRSIRESADSGAMGLKSNQSEDELFSDAVPEFSNNGANPSLDKNVGGEGGEVFHVLKDSHVSKDEKTAGTNQPPHGLAELLQGSIKARNILDYAVMRDETNRSETTNSISDIENEKVLDVVSSRPRLDSTSSLSISELIIVSESFHDTSELIVVADNNKTDRETGKRSSSLGPCIKDNENGDEANEDVHCSTTSEVLQSDHKLGIEPTSGPLELETTTTKVKKETLDPQAQSDFQFTLNNVNVDTSCARIVDETANQEVVLANDLQFKYDASSWTKHQELRDALSVSEVESDSPKQSIHCIPGLSNEVLDMEEAGNESTPFLSPAETFPAEENSRVMIGDFKDHEMLKSGSSLDFRAGEQERSSENDRKIPILETFQDALSKLPDVSVDWSSSNSSESKVEKHVSMADSGTFFISTTHHLPSTTANVFAGTIDELKEKSVSTTADREVGTAVPDLPSAQSSVHAENVAYSSVKVPNLQNSQNAVSNVSAGTVDNSSSDTFNGDLDKAGVSTPIDREIGMVVPENLSTVPYGTEGKSSLDALQDDLKNVGTSTLNGGGTSVTANILCPSSSISTGTSDEFLLDALKDDLKKEGVSTSVSVECIPPVPPIATEDSKVAAGMLEHITSEAMDDDLKMCSVSIPINGDPNTSLWDNLPTTNSSVLVGAVDNTASEPVADDLRKEVVSAPNDEEAGASSLEDLEGALSNIPIIGSSDNNLSEALKDGHEEGFSTLHDRDVGRSDLDNLPCVLSSLPPGTTDNSSKEASKDALTKDGVLTHNFVEVGSNIPVTGSSDNILSEALKDDHEEEGFSTLHDKDVGKSDLDSLLCVLSSVPAGTTDNSSKEASKDALTKEDVLAHNFVEVGSNIPIIGSSDNILLEALKDNHEEEFSTLHDRDVGRSDLDKLPCVLSIVPAGTTVNSSIDALTKEDALTHNFVEVGSNIPVVGSLDNILSEALKDDREEEGFSALHDRDVGRSDLDKFPCVLSSVPAGTTENSSKEASKDPLTEEGISTHNFVEVGSNIPVVGSSDNILSEALKDDREEKGFLSLHDRDVGRSDLDNLPCVLSSVPAGTTENSSKEASKDPLTKEGISKHNFVEVASNIPVVGSSDNILSEALENDHEEEGFSILHDRHVVRSDLDNLPCVLSSVLAGTTDNSSKEASKDALTEEAFLTPNFVEVGSSGFRETSGEDNQLLLLAATSPSVKNPEAMIGDFKDHKELKSSFTFDVGADEEIKLAEDDKKVTVSENPIPLNDITDGNIDNLEDNFKKEGVPIPIHGEVGTFRFMGTSDEESHLLSVADTSLTMDNPDALIEEFKDYKVLKSSFSMDLGASEEIISPENNKKVTAPENLPSAVSYGAPSEGIDSSPFDALEDDLRKDGVSIPIDGEIDASEFKFNNDVDFGSSSLGNYLKAPNCETNNNAERSLSLSVDRKSMQNEDLEPASRQESDVVPFEFSTGEQNLQMIKLCGGGNANSHGDYKLLRVSGNENLQPGDEPSVSDSPTFVPVEAIQETVLLVGNQSRGLENSSMGFSSIADIGTVEVTTEERLANQSHTRESSQQLASSECIDDARISHHMNVKAGASGKFCNSSESSRHTDEIPHNSEGLKMGEETKVSNLSSAPEIVSELKYEDPIQRSKQTPEGSNLKEAAAFAIESQKIRDLTILGSLQDNVDENITKPHLSILAADNNIVSSSRTDSLEGNWGSVSVLSTQSDVGNVADAEIVSSAETQAAEKLDDEFKKLEKGKGAAVESHPDKSDVFEPPSFMTLVESGVALDKNNTGQSKSEVHEKAGWFPSITNVVNESEGRKKNEEIISKVTNWSPVGKQHSPLKNLLNEAHAETKVKSLSPNAKQLVPAVNNEADETASVSKNNGTTQTTTTTVSSILGSEMPSNADTVRKEIENEWNSPARYPIQIKKEKRKGKPYWVPFVCCTSVQQDV